MLAIALKPLGVRPLVGLMKLPAALLTRRVSGPLSSQMRCTIASPAAASRISTEWVRTTPPRPATSSFAVLSSTAPRRPQSQSSAPSSRYLAAISLPSPVPPPVMRMRLPLRRSFLNMRASREGSPHFKSYLRARASQVSRIGTILCRLAVEKPRESARDEAPHFLRPCAPRGGVDLRYPRKVDPGHGCPFR